ncbi:hypothetical protein MIND_00979800 [Mycena indigotica]|uniref:Uncharacterized protein n=1 Tax=Mycena indigotica TaxID=2126181 RepID=A0A8H6SEX3_9AGAR|nr:uncharacterized protein MIND_00979800 [Mycena indigotica]KAF7297461.1 hypothetical protein MIND_00979800 [Mycena indigotica]
MALPAELLEQIVGHIPDTSSVKSCCLASSVLVYPCQKRLYNILTLPLADPATWERASERFQQVPHLLQHVEHLAIELSLLDLADSVWPDFFAKLLNLKSVSIMAGSTSGLIGWPTVPEPVAVALAALLRARHAHPLSRVSLTRVSQLSTEIVLLSFRATARLAITSCNIVEDDETPLVEMSTDESAGTGTAVSLRHSANIVKRFAQSPILRSLVACISSLAVSGHKQAIGNVLTLCQCVAPTISHLELPPSWQLSMSGSQSTALPSSWPNLLSVTLHLRKAELEDTSVLSWTLSALISSILPPDTCPALRDLIVVLDIPIDDMAGLEYAFDEVGLVEDEFDYTQPIPWSLDRTRLAAIDGLAAAHPRLATVQWTVVVNFDSIGLVEDASERLRAGSPAACIQYDACCAALRSEMPRMMEMGRLSFRGQDSSRR